MTKITKIPSKLLKDQNHPIMPRDATDDDIAYIEEENEAYIIIQTLYGSVVVDNSYNLTRFQQEMGTFGAIQASDTHPIGSSVWQSAEEAIRNYLKSNNG